MYSAQTFKFFRGIKKNSNKIWYEAHKESYKASYVQESAKLIEVLMKSPEFKALGLKGSAKTSLFRLHRDVRFSHDKTPYKHWNGLIMSRDGSKKASGVFYLHFEPGACHMAVGFWEPDPKLLAKMRSWVVDHAESYLMLEKKLKSRKLDFDVEHSLKRLPQGYQSVENTALHAALKRRHFIMSESLSDKDMSSASLVRKIRSFVKRSSPLMLWGWSLHDDL